MTTINENISGFKISNPNSEIIYIAQIPLPDSKSAEILARALSVDAEFTNEIVRKITIVNKNILNLEYKLKASHIKYLKKSVKAMYENMDLVLRTMKEFSNK